MSLSAWGGATSIKFERTQGFNQKVRSSLLIFQAFSLDYTQKRVHMSLIYPAWFFFDNDLGNV